MVFLILAPRVLVLIYTSFITNDLGYPLVAIFHEDAYSNLCPIFKLVIFLIVL